MLKEINITWIISAINSDAALNSIFNGRVFRWAPISDNQNWIFLIVNIVQGGSLDNPVTKSVRLEFKVFWNNKTVNYDSLIDAWNKISTFFIENAKLSDFWCYKVAIVWSPVQLIDEKDRKLIINDLIFYLTI